MSLSDTTARALRGRFDADRLIFWLAAVLVLGSLSLFVGYPLLIVLAKSFGAGDGGFGLTNYSQAFAGPRFWTALLHSLAVASTVTVVAVALGFLFAYTIARFNVPGRGLLQAVLALPMVAPSLVLGLGVILLLGRNGVVSRTFGVDLHIYGFWGIVIADALYCLPQAGLILAAALAQTDARPYEAAKVLGAGPLRIFMSITLPSVRFGLVNAALLVFTVTITDFGNAMVLGGDYSVLATEIYKQVSGQMNFGLGAVIAMVLLVPAAIASVIGHRVSRGQSAAVTDQARLLEPQPLAGAAWTLYAAVVVVALAMVATFGTVLLASLVKLWPYNFTLTLKHFSLDIPGGYAPLINSGKVAVATALAGTAVVGVGALLTQKWGHPIGRAIHILATLPAAIPGMVLGLAYVLAFNDPRNPFTFLYGTLAIIVACNIFHYHAQGYLTAVTSLKQVSRTFDEASITLGASFLQTLRWVLLPILLPALGSIAAFFFMRSMVTLSAVIFLVTPATTLAPVAVLQLDDAGSTSQAAALSVSIIGAVLVALALSRALAAAAGRYRAPGR